jgi:Na+/H+ antiporter NhaC
MKRNLLTAIAVFFITLVVLFALDKNSDSSIAKSDVQSYSLEE